MFTLLLAAGSTSQTLAQTLEDQQTVIQMCIDLEELQSFFHVDVIKGRQPLVIYYDSILPSNLKLTKYGKKVFFASTSEIFFYAFPTVLTFETFDISPLQANVIFHLYTKNITVKLTCAQVDGNWKITEHKLIKH